VSRILIVEGHMKDLSVAEQTAQSAGFSHIEARADVRSAKLYR
jgi:hypothetical protein